MAGTRTQSEQLTQRRRWRWPKGLVLFFGAWLLLLVGVRLWWGYAAQQRVNRALAASRAAGFLLTPEEVAAVPAPTQADAMWWVEEAIRRLPPPSPPTSFGLDMSTISSCLRNRIPLSTAQAQLLADTAPALAALRGARDLHGPLVVRLSAGSSAVRRLAWCVHASALLCAQEGQWAQAVELTRDGLVIERCLHERSPMPLIPRLVAFAVNALFALEAADYAAELDVADDAVPRVGQPATRAQVDALIADLLDERSQQEGWYEAMRAEALWVRTTFGSTIGGPTWATMTSPKALLGAGRQWFLAPLWQEDISRMEDFYQKLAPQHGSGPFNAAWRGIADPTLVAGSNRKRSGGFAAVDLLGTVSFAPSGQTGGFSVWVSENRSRAHRRLAACALAIRLYELEHGHPPASLMDLTPTYLAQLPRDPFDPEGGPVRYALAADGTPRVYSLDENMRDDGGTHSWNGPDIVITYGGPREDVRRSDARAGLVVVQPPNIARVLPPADLTPDAARRKLLEAAADVDQHVVDER